MSDREHDAEQGPADDAASTERAVGHAERDARRAERGAEREARREERRQRRGEWGASIGRALGDRIREEIERSVGGPDTAGTSTRSEEVIEHRFSVGGMPHVTVRNVSGETEIAAGQGGEVLVRATKRVHGWSEDRARRLLENVEIRLEQKGDHILIEPKLFEQERGWIEFFRGGRVAVDLDIRVPREAHLDASTVSGELSLTGVRGTVELRSVSGEVSVKDVQGPLRIRTVSGEVDATGYAGQLEANSVSGDIQFERSRVRAPDIVTVSGDIDIEAVTVPSEAGEGRVKTVSGDVELSLGDADVEIDFRSMSGDTEVEGPARIEKEGRRDRRIVIGAGTGRLRVKTVSGDLTIRDGRGPASRGPAPEAEESMPMGPAERPPGPANPAARHVLERVAKGELTVEQAAVELDVLRSGSSGEPADAR